MGFPNDNEAVQCSGKGRTQCDKSRQNCISPVQQMFRFCSADIFLHVRFLIGDLALFIRVSPPSEDSSKNAIFLAFNEEQPHYYLSEESARLAGDSAAYLVGR